MRYDSRLKPSPAELDILKEQTVDLIRERLGLRQDVAERVVAMSRSLDQAMSIAELMR